MRNPDYTVREDTQAPTQFDRRQMSDYLQRHHRYWPRRAYKTRVEKTFRNLPCNIDRVSAPEHKRIHRRYPNGNPGGKPTKAQMYSAIHKHLEGRCACPPKEVQLQLF